MEFLNWLFHHISQQLIHQFVMHQKYAMLLSAISPCCPQQQHHHHHHRRPNERHKPHHIIIIRNAFFHSHNWKCGINSLIPSHCCCVCCLHIWLPVYRKSDSPYLNSSEFMSCSHTCMFYGYILAACIICCGGYEIWFRWQLLPQSHWHWACACNMHFIINWNMNDNGDRNGNGNNNNNENNDKG